MVTALPLQQNKINVTSGTFAAVTIIHCEADGDITLNWPDGTNTSYSMIAESDRFSYEAVSVTIVSGTFTLAKA